jgi:hypothetical protein
MLFSRLVPPVTPLCPICRVFGQQCCKLHRLTAPCRNAAAARSRGYKPELKVIRGEHRAFVDPCSGQHPMHAGPIPSGHADEDTTSVEHPAFSCDCPCHLHRSDARLCTCCPAAGGWAATCRGQALTWGGHMRCQPGRCVEVAS